MRKDNAKIYTAVRGPAERGQFRMIATSSTVDLIKNLAVLLMNVLVQIFENIYELNFPLIK